MNFRSTGFGYQKEKTLYLFAIFISLLLSTLASVRSIVNPDGICYLMSAEEFNHNNFNAAIHLCAQSHWPFFSILIHSFAKISHLSYLYSAYVIDAAFTALSTLMFIFIVKALGGCRRTMLLAAAVVLLSHEFNAVRDYIVRDHGFWAFYLTSIWLFVLYFQTPKLQLAMAWYISLVIATLFRIEGAIFLLLLPFSLWLHPRFTWTTRFKLFVQLYLPTLLLTIFGLIYYAFNPQLSLSKLGRVTEVTHQLQHGFNIITERYATARSQLAAHVLPKDSAVHANLILLMMMISWYVTSVIINLSWGYSLLVAYAWIKRIHRNMLIWMPIAAYLVINVIITSSFLLERFFLSKRYLIALSLVLMLWVPFALNDLMQNRIYLRKRIFLILTSILIAVSALGGIIEFGYSKNYIADAGSWMAKHVPMNATLYMNDYQLMYYSQHFVGTELYKRLPIYVSLDTIAQGKWKAYDYVALRLTKKDNVKTKSILRELSGEPIKTFRNRRGDKVIVYKIATINTA